MDAPGLLLVASTTGAGRAVELIKIDLAINQHGGDAEADVFQVDRSGIEVRGHFGLKIDGYGFRHAIVLIVEADLE